MQKGTVIAGGVVHRTNETPDRDCGKLFATATASTSENAHSNPAENPERENGHFASEGSADGISGKRSQGCISYTKSDTDPYSNIKSIGGIKPERLGAFLTRVFTVVLAVAMTVPLGSFAGDMLNADGTLGTGAQSAYAATGTTPYTNIDVPLASNPNNASSGNSNSNNNTGNNNSDNANPNRVEATGGGTQGMDAADAGVLGPTLPSVASGRASDTDANSEDPDGDAYAGTYTDGPYAYERIKDNDDEDTGKVRLIKVDPMVGKVARIEANVSEIASGAFMDCEDLQTLIVFGDVKSIAKAQYDKYNNIIRQGAFTDEQLKSVHVVFAMTYLDETSLHETHPVRSEADSNGNANEGESVENNGEGTDGGDAGSSDIDDANVTDEDGAATSDSKDAGIMDGVRDEASNDGAGAIAVANGEDAEDSADSSTTPVDEGIKRLSGDVVLSAPSIRDSEDNVWTQSGFKNIVDTPQIGAKGTALASGEGDDGGDSRANSDRNDSQTDGITPGDQDNGRINENTSGQDADGNGSVIDLSDLSESDNEVLSQYGISVDSGSMSSGATANTAADASAAANIATDAGAGTAATADAAVISDAGTASNTDANAEAADGFTYTLLPDYTLEAAWNGGDDMPLDLALPDYGQVEGTIYQVSNSENFKADEANANQPIRRTSALSKIDYSIRFDTNLLQFLAITEGGTSYINGKPYKEAIFSGENNRYLTINIDFSVLKTHGNFKSYVNNPDWSIRMAIRVRGVHEALCPNQMQLHDINIYCNAFHSNGTGRGSGVGIAGGNFLPDKVDYYNNAFNYRAMGIVSTFTTGSEFYKSESKSSITSERYITSAKTDITVSLNLNGKGSLSSTSLARTPGSTYGSLPTPTAPTGYTFAGWYTAASGGSKIQSNTTVPSSNTTLYARWVANKYTVTFNSQEGSAVDAKQVTYDSTYGTLTTPTRPGYTFDGWFTAASDGTQRTASTTVKITSNEILYAHWHPTEYTITRTNKQGSDMDEASIRYTIESAPITIPNPSWANHNFVGWTIDMSASGETSKVPDVNIDYGAGQELAIETGTYGNITLTAQWFASEYSVIYDANGATNANSATPPPYAAKFGAKFNVAYATDTGLLGGTELVRDGYTFINWNTVQNGSGTQYAPGAEVLNLPAASGGTITLYAQWRAIPYTVAFHANYPGSTYSTITQTYVYDVGQTLRNNTFSRTGYTFDGWYTYKGSATPENEGDTPLSLNDREYITLRDAYVADNLGPSPTTLNLYAKWIANRYDVLLLAPDATSNAQMTVQATYDEHMPPVSIPVRPGYAFQGFYTQGESGGIRYYDNHGNSTRTWDIPHASTLYAQWSIVNYTIRYLPNGAVNEEGVEPYPYEEPAAYGRPISLRTAASIHFERRGYKCAGWRQIIDVNGNSYTYLETQSVSDLTETDGDIVDLYAIWEPIESQLILNSQGGAFNQFEINNSNTWRAMDSTYTSVYRAIKYDETYAFDVEPTRRGYDFIGWYTTPFADDPENLSTQVNSYDSFKEAQNQTLYAHWSQKTYFLTLSTAYNGVVLLENIPLLYEEKFKLPGDEEGMPPYMFDGEYATSASRNTYLSQYRDPNMSILGWSREASGTSSTYYTRGTEVAGLADGGNITLYLTQGPGTYFIKYNANKGEGPDDHIQAVRSGQEAALRPSEELFSRKGHTLSGWSPYPDATTPMYIRGSLVEDLADTDRTYNLYAVWTPITYRLILDNGRHGQLTKDIIFGQQYIGAPVPAPEDITDGTTFEGYYNFLFGDKMFFDRDGYINTQNEEIANGWNYVGESYIDEAGNAISNRTETTITLYGRFVTSVEFAYPYGGDDIRYTSAKYIVGIPYNSPVNQSVNDLGGLPVPVYGGAKQDASMEGVDEEGNVRTFAGWYTAAASGSFVADTASAQGPTRVDGAWQALKLYAAWTVDIAINMPNDPKYISPWTITGGAGWNKDTNTLTTIQGQSYANTSVGGLPTGNRAGYASGYKLVGFNTQGMRIYGANGENKWIDASGVDVSPGDAEQDGLALPEGHVQATDVVTSRYFYSLYPEYALNDIDVTVEIYEQGIRKAEALNNANFTLTRTYGVERRAESSLDAQSIIDETGNRPGFDYMRAVISHGDAGSECIEEALSYGAGSIGVGTSSSGETYDGHVAGDGRTVLRIYYSRHHFDFTLRDFYPENVEHVRGVARANGADIVRAESPSAHMGAFEFGNGDASTINVWFGEELTLEAKPAAGYKFSEWQIEDASDKTQDLSAAIEYADGSSSLAILTMPDTSVSVSPVCTPLPATYVVRGYFQEIGDATHASDVYVADIARGADIEEGLSGNVDSNTQVYKSEDEAGDFEGAVIARTVPGFVVSRIENLTITADNAAEVKVYYDRLKFNIDASWLDITDRVTYDTDGAVSLIDKTQNGQDAAIEPVKVENGTQTYSVLYEAEVALSARTGDWFELVGYDVSAAAWEGECLLEDVDQNGTIDPDSLDADTPGLPGFDPETGLSTTHTFNAHKAPCKNVTLKLKAQPLPATYISSYLFQDADPASETQAKDTYTLNRSEEMPESADYSIEVTKTTEDTPRKLRFWINGTDAYNHALDGTDASEEAAVRKGLDIPPIGFEPSKTAINELDALTPNGSEDGRNVVYSRYDRKHHNVSYRYIGGPNEEANQTPSGGSAPQTVSSYYGAKVKIADAPSVNGWSFSGWMWGDAQIGTDSDRESVTVPDADVEIAGTWSPIEYRLMFDGGSATEESPATNLPGDMAVSFNREWAVPGSLDDPDTLPKREGYMFIGWTFADEAWDARLADQPTMTEDELAAYKAELGAIDYFGGVSLLVQPGDAQKPWSFYQDASRTLHAVWMKNTYLLTIDLGGGTWPNGIDVPLNRYMPGSAMQIPKPERKGYKFLGWEACSLPDLPRPELTV